ncbi:uncharacterized protein LOC135072913 [Ostrinia nubilalis]|uniref:uncharacterized protein LOC114363454 n=1 Tax=Ostrinia furnacalis TaxID=93504 RepID=UPI00103DD6AD|nr:uncharacterized protein LOC114363454 [Ostrinia furnacalis]
MYHQLGKISGRLVAASHLQSPLFPIAPIALQRVEVPQIQYTTAQLSTVTEASACPAPGKRRLIPGTNQPYPPVPEAIRKRQEQFQTDDDVPVFLKGGPFDGILYRFTMALCIAGIIGVAHTIYIHAVPKKE